MPSLISFVLSCRCTMGDENRKTCNHLSKAKSLEHIIASRIVRSKRTVYSHNLVNRLTAE